MSQTYSIYEAKAKFSEVVRKAKEGKEIVVSERGTPVVKIVRLDGQKSFETHLQRLREAGLLIRAQTSGHWPEPGKQVEGALKAFLQDR